MTEIMKCACGCQPAVVKEKVSVGVVTCECGCVGPSTTAETHDEVEISATEAWNAVRTANTVVTEDTEGVDPHINPETPS